MKMLGIIGAMASEVDNIVARMTAVTERRVAGRVFYTGRLANAPVTVVQSGIGKVAAAITAQMLMDLFRVDALLNTGMGGGLDSRLRVKDLVIGADAVQHDYDLTAFGHAPGYITGEDDQQPTAFAADPAMVAAAEMAARQVLPAGSKAIVGRIASGDIFVDDSDLKARIIRLFGAAATEMEGAAIAQTAAENGVPFVILRTISDMAEDGAKVSFTELEHHVGQLAGDITVAMLPHL